MNCSSVEWMDSEELNGMHWYYCLFFTVDYLNTNIGIGLASYIATNGEWNAYTVDSKEMELLNNPRTEIK